MNKITVRCPAKLNLFLKIVGTDKNDSKHRHLLDTVFQAINLFDLLTIERSDIEDSHLPDESAHYDNGYVNNESADNGRADNEFADNGCADNRHNNNDPAENKPDNDSSGKIQIEFDIENPKLPAVKDNLCYKAAKLFEEKTGIDINVNIFIEKNIPMSGGMAGGSSDCAGTLYALNNLYDNPLEYDELYNLACELGSDVPFLLAVIQSNFDETICRATNFGDVLHPIPQAKPDKYLTIITFDFGISTVESYKTFDKMSNNFYSAGGTNIEPKVSSANNIHEYNSAPGADNTGADNTGADNTGAHSQSRITVIDGLEFYNDLEFVACELNENVKNTLNFLKGNNIFAQVTGSGPTIFALSDSDENAKKIKEAVEDFNKNAHAKIDKILITKCI